MRIVIDLQAGQGHSGLRGIGRYSRSLALSITRLAMDRGHDVCLVMNASLPMLIPSIRKEFAGLLPDENIFLFPGLENTADIAPENRARMLRSEAVREHFIAALKPDILHVASLFEGFVDDVTVSINDHVALPTAVTLYDLIPYVMPELYLTDPRFEKYYLRRLDALRHAQWLLAISNHTREEALTLLERDPERVTNISAAVADIFRPRRISEQRRAELAALYGIRGEFLLYVPGGFDPRKNFAALLQAYARLPATLRATHQLVIGSKVYPGELPLFTALRDQAGLTGADVVLTGYLPDDDLVDLFNLCTAHVFPSLHEGFGLPALEAMSCGAPSIGSNATSLPEVLGRSDALFDPRCPDSIARKMTEVLSDAEFRGSLREHALRHSAGFSWDHSGKRALEAFEAALV